MAITLRRLRRTGRGAFTSPLECTLHLFPPLLFSPVFLPHPSSRAGAPLEDTPAQSIKGTPLSGNKLHDGERSKEREADVSDKAQRRLLSLLVIVTFLALDSPLKKFVAEKVPERRGPRDDVTEAILQGAARMVAVIIASVFVRQLAKQRR